MSPTVAPPRLFTRRAAWLFLPLLLLIAGGLLANVGMGTRNATAATGSVQVNATVTSNVTLTPCGATLAISVTLNSLSHGTCNVTFGATNNAALPMTIMDNNGAAQFFTGTHFPEDAGGCTILSVDSVGYKVNSTGLTATENHPCSASAAATNLDYTNFPNTATTVCTTSALGNQVCPIAVGVFETGNDAPPAVYTGDFDLAA